MARPCELVGDEVITKERNWIIGNQQKKEIKREKCDEMVQYSVDGKRKELVEKRDEKEGKKERKEGTEKEEPKQMKKGTHTKGKVI